MCLKTSHWKIWTIYSDRQMSINRKFTDFPTFTYGLTKCLWNHFCRHFIQLLISIFLQCLWNDFKRKRTTTSQNTDTSPAQQLQLRLRLRQRFSPLIICAYTKQKPEVRRLRGAFLKFFIKPAQFEHFKCHWLHLALVSLVCGNGYLSPAWLTFLVRKRENFF